MKKKIFYAVALFSLLATTVCCKDEKGNTIRRDNNSGLDTQTKTDTARPFKGYSLNRLMAIYNQYAALESKEGMKMALKAAREIKDIHKISDTLYLEYTERFWGTGNSPQTKSYNKSQLETLLGKSENDEYVEFTFDADPDADFSTNIVSMHSFKTTRSCIPVLTFRKMLDDKDFVSLEVTKGTKIYHKPPSKYNGPYNMTVFKFTTTARIQYFDIVSDPTIGT